MNNVYKIIEEVLSEQSSLNANLSSSAARKQIAEQVCLRIIGKFYVLPYSDCKESQSDE